MHVLTVRDANYEFTVLYTLGRNNYQNEAVPAVTRKHDQEY